MSLEPVSSIHRAAVARPAAPGAQTRAGQNPAVTLRLILGSAQAGERWAHGENGQVYRFGIGEALPAWREGQTMLLEVLRAGPPIEVKVLGLLTPDEAAAGASRHLHTDTPAVQPDQAAILRLAAATSDTMAQAAHWRQRSLDALQQAATLSPEQPPGTTQPASTPPGEAALLLRILPWHGWPLSLWLEQRRWNGSTNRRARRRASTRLGLSLNLPPVGTIGLLLDVLDVQVGLTITAADAAAVAALRDQVGAISTRMARAGLRLMRCHVRHDPALRAPTHTTSDPSLGSHELPLALFRAGAEALETLRRGLGRASK
jgi:hypothetical protein